MARLSIPLQEREHTIREQRMRPLRRPPHLPADTTRSHNRVQAVELHRRGWTQTAIADQLGVTQSAVSKWLDAALHADQARLEEEAPFLRADMDAKLAWLERKLTDAIEEGDIAQASALLRLHERRAKLHGLDAPIKTEDVTERPYRRQIVLVHSAPSQLPETIEAIEAESGQEASQA